MTNLLYILAEDVVENEAVMLVLAPNDGSLYLLNSIPVGTGNVSIDCTTFDEVLTGDLVVVKSEGGLVFWEIYGTA